jgi:hypothetical protein
MRTKALISVTSLLVIAACASTADCSADAYQLGRRDGRLGAGLEAQADIYGARCGAPIDRARYTEGYRDGFRERPIPLW